MLGFEGEIAAMGISAPIQAGRQGPVERTHSWTNGHGKLRRFTDRRTVIIESQSTPSSIQPAVITIEVTAAPVLPSRVTSHPATRRLRLPAAPASDGGGASTIGAVSRGSRDQRFGPCVVVASVEGTKSVDAGDASGGRSRRPRAEYLHIRKHRRPTRGPTHLERARSW